MGHLPRHRHLGRHVDDRDRGDPRRALRPGDAVARRPTPPAATAYSNPELEEISEQLRDELPGYLGSYGGEGTDGHVLADVLYDDGSLQAWADTTYGEDVVVVSSALVDAG